MVLPLISVFWHDLNLRQTSQRQAFCGAWKTLKSVLSFGSATVAEVVVYC